MMKTAAAMFIIIALVGSRVCAQITTRVSVDSAGSEGDGLSSGPSMSADGRFVAFYSDATNLVAGDLNGARDVFVHDRQTGETTRVSVDSSGVEGNGLSSGPSISADGRFVTFYSDANNLVQGDANAVRDVFVHDRQTGVTTRVSVDSSGAEANAASSGPSISADGLFVAFYSDATNLVPGDGNAVRDAFVHNRQTGVTTRVSVDSSGAEGNALSSGPWISGDGQSVAFYSDATNLVSTDTNGVRDVFVHDLTGGRTTLVSADSHEVIGNDKSGDPSISFDGRYVAFYSDATNLVSGDTNAVRDVFVHDRQTGFTGRVSVDSGGVQGDGASNGAAISGSGHDVAFYSDATNLVPGDLNSDEDVFVYSSVALLLNGVPKNPNDLSFTLVNANSTQVGSVMLVLLSCTGTSGFPLPDGQTLYLTFDKCTMVGLKIHQVFEGTIDATGRADTPSFVFPTEPPGILFYAAAYTFDVARSKFVSVTDPIWFTTE
jgi:Tol biopolymer transport system component